MRNVGQHETIKHYPEVTVYIISAEPLSGTVSADQVRGGKTEKYIRNFILQ